MKGVSTVIATILMLMITIALAGTAYLYISGSFSTQLQGLEVTDSFCTGVGPASAVTIKVRNLGTNAISTVTCTQTSPAAENTGTCTSTPGPSTPAPSPLDAGVSGDITDTCGGTGSRSCIYRLVPPSERSVVATVSCA